MKHLSLVAVATVTLSGVIVIFVHYWLRLFPVT
ncbi:hypothetical protein P3T40_004678 [Paraburkholderia sp. EB58]|jgi:hypothetical protein